MYKLVFRFVLKINFCVDKQNNKEKPEIEMGLLDKVWNKLTINNVDMTGLGMSCLKFKVLLAGLEGGCV